MIWIDNCLDAIRPGLSWKDAPVECVINKLFKRRLDLFLQKYIIGGNGLLGRVEHHAIRIEFQDRGSRHSLPVILVDPQTYVSNRESQMKSLPSYQASAWMLHNRRH